MFHNSCLNLVLKLLLCERGSNIALEVEIVAQASIGIPIGMGTSCYCNPNSPCNGNGHRLILSVQ